EENRTLQLVELAPFADDALIAEELRSQRAVLPPLDRDDRLAEQIAAHHLRIGLVELRRAEELAPQEVGAVDVRGVEEPHASGALVGPLPPEPHYPTSSGSSYHCTRSPTRARSFHFVDFGSASMRLRRSSSRETTISSS